MSYDMHVSRKLLNFSFKKKSLETKNWENDILFSTYFLFLMRFFLLKYLIHMHIKLQ